MQSGQAVLELTFSAGLVALTLAGAGWVLQAEWNRGRCAYLTFETTHARLVGRRPNATARQVETEENEREVRGEGRCGKIVEKVALRRLEAVAW